jgi:hypothetical protein
MSFQRSAPCDIRSHSAQICAEVAQFPISFTLSGSRPVLIAEA